MFFTDVYRCVQCVDVQGEDKGERDNSIQQKWYFKAKRNTLWMGWPKSANTSVNAGAGADAAVAAGASVSEGGCEVVVK